MSKLIIIRGNSGSGKTTLARALQHKFGRNTMVISQDVIRRDMLWVKDGVGTEALPLLINLLQYGKEHSEIVILEGILYFDVYEELFQTAIREFSPEILAYYYDLPFEETLLRHQSKPNCHEFGGTEMRRWWREKDFIGSIPEKTLSAEISLEDTIELIYRETNSFS
ncbi:MAG: kinase [Lachnospiraceae bacterium]|nr:kinase [Lachnospiraceae bacterium]